MNIKEINNLYEQAIKHIDLKEFIDALTVTNEINENSSLPFSKVIVGSLYTEIGYDLVDKNIIKNGIEILEKHMDEIVKEKKYTSQLFFNLGNGYDYIHRLELHENKNEIYFNIESELDKVKKFFRKALENSELDNYLRPAILMNLGNCYDHLGRNIDALECYEGALKIKPDYGLALGNKGMSLFFYSSLAGEFRYKFLNEAYNLLSQGIKLKVPSDAEMVFNVYLTSIEKIISKNYITKTEKKIELQVKDEKYFKKELIEFCLNNKLYLNSCNFCQECETAIGDSAIIKEMIIEINDKEKLNDVYENKYLHFSAYLNQIKQDYITARFLLFISRCRKFNLDIADDKVKLIDTLDYTIYNIYLELLKTSFKLFYNILDKIAFFINDYLKLNIKSEEIYFNSFWYLNTKRKNTIRSEIINTKNISLNALFDIQKDFQLGPYHHLKKLRNMLTHRFIKIQNSFMLKKEEILSEQSLFDQTLELAKIVRNSIIYLLHFIYIEEKKKEKNGKEKIPILIATEYPDEFKRIL
jgi:hypothetical protein